MTNHCIRQVPNKYYFRYPSVVNQEQHFVRFITTQEEKERNKNRETETDKSTTFTSTILVLNRTNQSHDFTPVKINE